LVTFAGANTRRLTAIFWNLGVRNSHDVSDLIQDVYARILASSFATAVDEPLHLVSAIARNVGIDYIRHLTIQKRAFVGAAANPYHEPDEETEVNEIADTSGPEVRYAAEQELSLLHLAISAIPKGSRKVFILRKVYQLSQKEIARHLDISENTVEQHLAKAIKIFCTALGRELPRKVRLARRLPRV